MYLFKRQALLTIIAAVAVVFTITNIASAADESEEKLAATAAGGVEVTVAEVEELAAPQIQNMPEQARASQAPMVKKRALDSLLFQKLLEIKFEESKVTIKDEVLDAEIDEILKENNITVDEFKERVAQMGRSYDEFREQVRSGMKYQKMMDDLAGDELKVTDEDVETYYTQNKQRFEQPEQVQASHILVAFDPDAEDAEKQAAKTKAEALRKKALDGEDFAQLAAENSDCPSGQGGGDLGFFSKDRMVEPFANAAFAMPKGEISKVVETQFGYHVILVTDKQEAKTITFEEAKDDIKAQLEDDKRRQFAGKFRDELLEESDIVYYDEFAVKQQPQQMQIMPQPQPQN